MWRDEEFLSYLTSLEKGFPSLVQLFVANYVCNSNCRYCPIGKINFGDAQRKTHEKEAFMEWSVFEKVAREVGKHPETILRFHGRGEPTMHPRFIDMVSFAKQMGIRHVATFTNGILVSHDYAKGLLGAGIDLIEFSVDAFTPETYSLLRRTSMFDTVKSNVLETIRLRDEMKKDAKIFVSAVDHTEFAKEKEKFQDYWSKYADEVIFRRRTSFNDRVSYADWNKIESVNAYPCIQPWTRFNVSPFGKVNFCANDWGDEFLVGDLNDTEDTIESIWKSEKYQEFRNLHLKLGIPKNYCLNCTESSEANWKNSYEKIIASFSKNES